MALFWIASICSICPLVRAYCHSGTHYSSTGRIYCAVVVKKDLLHDAFSVYMLDSCMNDDCLMSVFLPLNVAVQTVYENFRQYF